MKAPDPGPMRSTDHSPESDRNLATQESSLAASILMIGHDPQLMAYRCAVLATAKLSVQSASPSQAQAILRSGANYSVIILSHTLEQTEILEIERTARQCKTDAKLLLMLGPRDVPPDRALFDATMHGLDGPSAFIHTVRRLVGNGA